MSARRSFGLISKGGSMCCGEELYASPNRRVKRMLRCWAYHSRLALFVELRRFLLPSGIVLSFPYSLHVPERRKPHMRNTFFVEKICGFHKSFVKWVLRMRLSCPNGAQWRRTAAPCPQNEEFLSHCRAIRGEFRSPTNLPLEPRRRDRVVRSRARIDPYKRQRPARKPQLSHRPKSAGKN